MKRFILPLICLAIGVALGWYFGYTRPALEAMHLYREVQRTTGMSDAEMVKAVPDSLAAIKRDDEGTAMVALRGIEILDQGDTGGAKKYLAYWVGSYYRVYHTNGDSNLISRIERAATTNAFIEAEITKKVQ